MPYKVAGLKKYPIYSPKADPMARYILLPLYTPPPPPPRVRVQGTLIYGPCRAFQLPALSVYFPFIGGTISGTWSSSPLWSQFVFRTVKEWTELPAAVAEVGSLERSKSQLVAPCT